MEQINKIQQAEPIEKLFINWYNNEDPEAASKMVYRFELWFDSLSLFYLGENSQKQQIYKKICQTFSSNIKQIRKPKELVPFAHDILHKTLPKEILTEKDYTSSMLNERSAGDLIKEVWGNLSPSEQSILLQNYQSSEPVSNLYKLLSARASLKRLLQQVGINFMILEQNPDPDLIPLPLFEAGKLKSKDEERYFEYWLLNVESVCRDIAEFAPFTQALKLENFGAKPVKPTKETVVALQPTLEVQEEQEPTESISPKEEAPVSQTQSSSNVVRPVAFAIILGIIIIAVMLVLSII